jgi:branched-chain amino acid transport system permease protein
MLRLAAIGAIAAIGFFLPQFLGGSTLVYSTVVVIAIFSVMAYGVDIVLSDLGEVSLAHTMFFAAGAYAVGVLGVRYGSSSWLTLAAAVGLAALLALGLGLVTLRIRHFVFSLVTYAANIVCLNVAQNWTFLGASDGIVGIPPLDLSIGPLQLEPLGNKDLWPYAYALLLGTLLFVSCFRRSRLGHAALMVHMNPRLATMNGIDPRRIRLRVLVLSAAVTSLGGWLYSYQRAYVGPDLFEPYFLILMLTAVVLAGRRVLLGPLLGTAILMVQKAFLSYGGYFDKIVLGAVLVLILSVYPRGLIGLWERLASWRVSARADQTTARPTTHLLRRLLWL